MRELEDAIERAEDRIRFLPVSEVRRLRESAQLAPEYAGEVLGLARSEGWVTVREVNLVEHFIETWPEHGLSAKLAIMDRVKSLSDRCCVGKD